MTENRGLTRLRVVSKAKEDCLQLLKLCLRPRRSLNTRLQARTIDSRVGAFIIEFPDTWVASRGKHRVLGQLGFQLFEAIDFRFIEFRIRGTAFFFPFYISRRP